jgi:hypothetical protein
MFAPCPDAGETGVPSAPNMDKMQGRTRCRTDAGVCVQRLGRAADCRKERNGSGPLQSEVTQDRRGLLAERRERADQAERDG